MNTTVRQDYIPPKSYKDSLNLRVKWENEGIGTLNQEDGYNCLLCRNKGYVVEVIDGYMTAVECQCMNVRKTIRQVRKSGLDDYLKDYTFKNWKRLDDMAVNMGERAWANVGTKRWFYAGGQTGAGKSHICTAICLEELRRGQEVVYKSWLETIRALKNAKTDEKVYCKLMSELVGCKILYLDDLFKGSNTSDSDITTTFEVIDARYRAAKKTIISSERNIKDLYSIDPALANRITQRALGDIVTIDQDKNYDRRIREDE